MTEIERARAHFEQFHRRTRMSGFVPSPSPDELEARRAQERSEAEASLAGSLDGLADDVRKQIIDRVTASRREALIEGLIRALPPKIEPVPHSIEGCGIANAEERRILDAGMLVRVRSDFCNDPACKHVRRGLSRARHDRAHEAAVRLAAEGYAVH